MPDKCRHSQYWIDHKNNNKRCPWQQESTCYNQKCFEYFYLPFKSWSLASFPRWSLARRILCNRWHCCQGDLLCVDSVQMGASNEEDFAIHKDKEENWQNISCDEHNERKFITQTPDWTLVAIIRGNGCAICDETGQCECAKPRNSDDLLDSAVVHAWQVI